MKKWKKPLLFCLGGGAYVGLELLYRRRSHISMFAAGGICFLALGALEKQTSLRGASLSSVPASSRPWNC